jgi:predicted PurR-regulated permease PerM
MNENRNLSNGKDEFGKTLHLIIKLGLILGLIVGCFMILKPFILITLWGLIIAVSIYPLYNWLAKKLGNRKKMASILVTLLVLIIISIPFVLLGKTFWDGITKVRTILEGGDFVIPQPSETIKTWPLIGEPIYKLFDGFAHNMDAAVAQYQPQIKAFLLWFLNAAKNTSVEFLKFIVSIIISGVLLLISDSGWKFINEFAVRLAGNKGNEFVETSIKTIRNVFKGIIGVALIQSTLAGIGFLVAGVPAAGLWAMICLFLGIIQIGILPVCIGVVIYMFIAAPTWIAICLMIWCIILGPLDNVLKPIFLGRGAKSPMLVIFLGAIGGFIYFGLIGLFFGAVLLSLGYDLFMIWVKEPSE